MWKLYLPVILLMFTIGCEHKNKERILHGRVKEITQKIEHHGVTTITIKFHENGTEIELVSDKNPIGGEDYTDQEVVLTYNIKQWENEFVRLEKVKDYAKQKYEEAKSEQ